MWGPPGTFSPDCLEDQMIHSGFLESAEVGSHRLSAPSFGSSSSPIMEADLEESGLGLQ